MSYIKKIVVCLIVSFILLYSRSRVYASTGVVFRDDFVFLDENKWSVYDHDGDISIVSDDGEDGLIRLSSGIDVDLPLIQLKQNISELINYSIEARYRMTSWGFGSGIILSDKQLQPYSPLDMALDDFIFVTWPNAIGWYDIVSRPCSNGDESCSHDNSGRPIKQFEDTSWHIFKFSYSDGIYSVYNDGVKIFESEPTDLKIQYIYFGSPHRTNNPTAWPTHDLDYIVITNDDVAQEETRTKIVLLPGMGTSWDLGAIMSGTPGNNWEIPPFVNVYDSLIKSIENNGYVKGEDLFVFAYDWRKPLDSLADDFKNYLVSLGIPEDEKVALVGHSMGGLVAKAYLNKYGDEKIEKLITLGSPHRGVTEAYSLWEGATVWGNIWWEKAILELAVHLNNTPGESRVETLRSQAPGIKDILPTYDYLRIKGGLKPWNTLIQKNDYLHSLNSNDGNISIFTEAFVGTGGDTRNQINAQARDGIDRLLDRWEDGKPVETNPFTFTDGDGTVIKASAGALFDTTEINTNHIGLAYDRSSIENILTKLDLDSTKTEIVELDTRGDFLAIILRSPGRIRVCNEDKTSCDGDLGLYFPNEKMFLLPGYSGENLSTEVIEDGTGEYALHVGFVSDREDWLVMSGELKSQGQIDEYAVQEEDGEVEVVPSGDTEDRNDLVLAENLQAFSPNWDKLGYFAKAGDERLSEKQRLKYIRLLRTILRNEFRKAVKQNNYDYLLAINSVWNENDRYSYRLLMGENSLRESSVTSFYYRVNRLAETIKKRMLRSNRDMAAIIYEYAIEKIGEQEVIETQNTDLRSDMLMSAEYLLFSAQDSL